MTGPSTSSVSTDSSITTAACVIDKARTVFYGSSTISLTYTCDQPINSVNTSNMPAFLTSSVSGNSVTFTGVAPTSASVSDWSFTINDISSTSFYVNTTVLASSSLIASLSPPSAFNVASGAGTSNSADFKLGLTLTLASAWDGTSSTATFNTTAIKSDIPSLLLYDSCTSATAPYVCTGTASISDRTLDSGLHLKWLWSAFDQGSYYIDITSQLTLDGGTTTLPATTFSETIPIQTTGNVTIHAVNDPDSSNAYDSQRFRYGVGISANSTPLAPVIGLLYIDKNTGVRPYLQRIVVDRTNAPGSGSSGITQSATVLEQNTANSQDFTINALNDGSWAIIGSIATLGSYDLLFNHVTDSATTPTKATSVQLTTFSSTTDRAVEVAASKPFSESGTNRLGLAFVRRNTTGGTDNLVVAKINPMGTTSATISDDSNYGVISGGSYSHYETSSTSVNTIDRLKMQWISENGTGYFYIAYRDQTNLKLIKLLSHYNAGYSASNANLATGVFANLGTNGSPQALDLDLGTNNSATVVGVTYRTNTGDCYFQHADSSLVATTAVKITDNTCYNPSVHYNDATGRFVVTYAELNGSGNYDIKYREITIGTSDTAGTATVVVADLTNYPVRLATDFYSAGSWMALFYRLYSSSTLVFHGYHVSGR